MKKKTKSEHNPNLKTIVMIENVVKSADQPIRRSEIKKLLKKKVMHQTLNAVLNFLEERNMILDTHKGIIWLDEPNAKLSKALKQGINL